MDITLWVRGSNLADISINIILKHTHWPLYYMAATLWNYGHTHGQTERWAEERWLSEFERGIDVGDGQAGWSISETAALLGFSHITSPVFTEERKYPVSSSPLGGNACWYQSYEENGQTASSWEEGKSNSRRAHWVPILLAKNTKLRLQFIQTHWNWTREDWGEKNMDCLDFCWHLLVSTRICH